MGKRFTVTVVSFKGKTVYRKCSCGETCFDAKYIATGSDGVDKFFYKCRNCFKLAEFLK